MKNILLSAMLATILLVPSHAQAGGTLPPRATIAAAPQVQLSKPVSVEISTDIMRDYAAREAAAPQLAKFAGGDGGVYVGTGVLAVALIIVVAILILR